jgi:DNA-binding MarR family transcriptional regulator
MPVAAAIPLEATLHVRDSCLCLRAQLAGRFDEALRPAGLTNNQFSLLNVLNGSQPKTLGAVAALIGADRTTVTAALKPLVRQGLARIGPDRADRRIRRIALTAQGHARLAIALPLRTEAHEALETALDRGRLGRVRNDLEVLSAAGRNTPADLPGEARIPPARAGHS